MCRRLFVSHEGHNAFDCGDESNPCQNISYTVRERATGEDAVYVEAANSPYIIKETITIHHSLSLVGYKGNATIKVEYGLPLFQYSIYLSSVKISILLNDLRFEGGSIIRNINGTFGHKFIIKISNCSFRNAPSAVVSAFQRDHVTDLGIIIANSSFYGCGGIIYISSKVRNLTIDVSGSFIRGSFLNQTGIDIIYAETVNTNVNIVQTNFTYLRRCLALKNVIFPASKVKATIHRSVFISSGEANGSIIAIGTPSSVLITNSTFEKNSGISIFIYSNCFVRVKNCRFLFNRGRAFYQFAPKSSDTTFTRCHFEGNGEVQYGGAIYNDLNGLCRFEKSIFKENTAFISGGTIYNSPFAKQLQMINCQIYVGRKAPSGGYSGEVLYVGSRKPGTYVGCDNTFLKNVTISAPKGFDTYPSQRAMIFASKVCIHNVTVRCPNGWNTSVFAFFPNYYETVKTSCSACPPKTYSIHSSKVSVSSAFKEGYKIDPLHCYPCPYGGQCGNGIVRPQNNFWGYQLKDKLGEVRFVTCPVDYCCLGNQCQKYNSCNYNRVGTLCGQCREGFSEDTLTSNCIPNTECNKIWFWVIFGCAGILYAIFFMYMKEIISYIGRIFNLRRTLQFPKKRNDLEISLMQNEDIHGEKMVSVSDNSRNTSANDKIVYSGLIKIIFFFYQIQPLFDTSHVTRQHVKDILWASREVTSSIFNLKILNGQYGHRVGLCGFTGQQPVTKVVLKFSFIIYIIVVFGITGSLSEVLRWRKKGQGNEQSITPFQVRVVASLLQTLLLGYSVLTVSTMTLLRCQSVYGFDRVLFIDGNVSCLTQWQRILFVVIIIWIVPFPLAIYLSSRGLARRELSTKRVFLAISLPLVFVIQSIYFYCYHRKQNRNNNDSDFSNSHSDSEESDSNQNPYSNHTKAILDILQGPFRKTLDPSTGNLAPFHWEAVLIFRRLALISIRTFVSNQVIQLYLMLLLLSFFLFHHEFVLPFSNRLLNKAESISLMCLCLLCAMGITKAYNYAYPLTSSQNFDVVLNFFSYVETFLLIIIPILIVFYILIAIIVRFLHAVWVVLKLVAWAVLFCWRQCNLRQQ